MKKLIASFLMAGVAFAANAGWQTVSVDNVWSLNASSQRDAENPLIIHRSATILGAKQENAYITVPGKAGRILVFARHLPFSELKIPSVVLVREYDKTVPFAVTGLGDGAFSGHNGENEDRDIRDVLKSVVIPDSVKTIGRSLFNKCYSLESVTFPESVSSIGTTFMFYECRSLESVTLPRGTLSIGYQMFFGCTKLKAIELPTGVKTIRERAFEGCSALTEIRIPETVDDVARGAFKGVPPTCKLVVPANEFWLKRVKDAQYESLPVVFPAES